MAADFITFEELCDLHAVMTTAHGQLVLTGENPIPEPLVVHDEHGNRLGKVYLEPETELADGSVVQQIVFEPAGWPEG